MENQNLINNVAEQPIITPVQNAPEKKSFFSSKLLLVVFVLVLIGASSGTTYYFMGVNKENTPIVASPTVIPTQTVQPTPTTKPTQEITPTIQITQPATVNSDKPLLTAATNACETYIYKDVNKCLNPSVEDQKDIYGLVRISDMRILMKKDGNDWKFSTASSVTDNPDFCSTGSGNTDLIKYCNIR
ncbi:hypothetical protein KKG52_03840 [Patescibacteria group bacterium]|nr:hypothetical protein [Patescibacteria group bacterium]